MKLLAYADLKQRGIFYSKVHLWRLVKSGQFPKPVKLGAGRNAWVETEIDAYIEKKVAERDAVTA